MHVRTSEPFSMMMIDPITILIKFNDHTPSNGKIAFLH
jgi:hypothetical protein